MSSTTNGQGNLPESMSDDVTRTLAAVAFPANKDALVQAARATGASNEIVRAFDSLPEQDYADAGAVSAAFSQANQY
jgi:hypothetical protein